MNKYSDFMKNEGVGWERIKKLKVDFMRMVETKEKDGVGRDLHQAAIAVQNILQVIKEAGFDFTGMSVTHGTGHIVRNYAHCWLLFENLEGISSEDLFCGFIAGCLHDIGCLFFDRYSEHRHVIRHAEASALLLQEFFGEKQFNGLTEREKKKILYAVSAHTHYLNDVVVNCSDGERRATNPYIDVNNSGKPIWPVWLARWIDRLDINSPQAYPARLYLPLVKSRVDYKQEGFYEVEYHDYMSITETHGVFGDRSMAYSLNQIADTQNNNSPYGKFDFGKMIELRDKYRDWYYEFFEIIKLRRIFSLKEKEMILGSWTNYLWHNIEPTEKARKYAEELEKEFNKLDENTQSGWLSGFVFMLRKYVEWSEMTLGRLNSLPSEFLKLPGMSEDIREIIKPHADWILYIENNF